MIMNMMRTWAAGLAVMLLAIALRPVAPAYAQEPSAAGAWKQIDDKTGRLRSIITISESGGVYGGVISKVFPREGEKPMPLCIKCTGALANTPIIGMPLLSGLKRNGLSYTGGSIVDPETGTVYSVKMELSPDGQTLAVRGFVGVSLLGRTQKWEREK
jgi:uncharacterized protein (DUF2147 family)